MELAPCISDAVVSEYAIENGHEEQSQNGRECETTDHSRTHRPPHLGSLTGANGHRHHAKNCSKGCHDDRTQTRFAAVDDRPSDREAALSVKRYIVYQHDTVLDHDAYKHDRSDHRHDVERMA